MSVRTLRVTRDCCGTGYCPSIHRVDDRPGVFVIGKVVDAATREKFADLIGPDEDLVWVPDDVLPEVAP